MGDCQTETLVLEPLEQPPDVGHVVRGLAQLGLGRARLQDARYDRPLAVVQPNVLSLVALVLPGTTHEYAMRQAGPSIWPRSPKPLRAPALQSSRGS